MYIFRISDPLTKDCRNAEQVGNWGRFSQHGIVGWDCVRFGRGCRVVVAVPHGRATSASVLAARAGRVVLRGHDELGVFLALARPSRV